MLKTFISIIAEVGNKIRDRKNSENNMEEKYDGGLGQPYSQRKWGENYYGDQFCNTTLKKDNEDV